ncbi:unnamed protein product [Linum trigynum]|uniref:Secreted protein n=1 Tax=Linum trigynum TaxID=586398 RepID=A0AAV2ENC8_9ROSI
MFVFGSLDGSTGLCLDVLEAARNFVAAPFSFAFFDFAAKLAVVQIEHSRVRGAWLHSLPTDDRFGCSASPFDHHFEWFCARLRGHFYGLSHICSVDLCW